ncbi:hypothetical protein DL765_011442 [Monosporascus sp. GIB2]|nr:hypothetical protein DL765_011442 [Monosporascus sp. GIB2]
MGFALGLGIIADVVGIYSFIDDQTSHVNKAGASYRIQAGHNGFKNSYDAQGRRPQAALMSEFYVNNNAVCIATITKTLHDDTKYALAGDSGQIYKADWYYSGVTVDSGKLTKCMWMDQNDNNNPKEAVISIYFPTFGTEEVPDTEGTELCGDVQGLRARDEGGGSELLRDRSHGGEKLRSRVILPGKRAGDDRLVVSPEPNHKATELCNAGQTFGPRFVSLVERVSCDIGTRELLPLCQPGVTRNCFGLEAARASVSSRRISAVPTKPRREILES